MDYGNRNITKKDVILIDKGYFQIIKVTENYVEIKSKNTKHCWIIQKQPLLQERKPVYLYHKHRQNDAYYHKHWETYSVKQAIKSIKGHDKYVINNPGYLY